MDSAAARADSRRTAIDEQGSRGKRAGARPAITGNESEAGLSQQPGLQQGAQLIGGAAAGRTTQTTRPGKRAERRGRARGGERPGSGGETGNRRRNLRGDVEGAGRFIPAGLRFPVVGGCPADGRHERRGSKRVGHAGRGGLPGMGGNIARRADRRMSVVRTASPDGMHKKRGQRNQGCSGSIGHTRGSGPSTSNYAVFSAIGQQREVTGPGTAGWRRRGIRVRCRSGLPHPVC